MVVGDVYVIWRHELELLPDSPPETPHSFPYPIRWKGGRDDLPTIHVQEESGSCVEYVAMIIDAQFVRAVLAPMRAEARFCNNSTRTNALDVVVASINAAERVLELMKEVL